jgi:TRAP-type uncharacterized transport system substrate-binding protein
MEPQPELRRGAPNAAMIRNVMMSEIALAISDTAKARANTTRTLYVAVGSGAGEQFRPWLRLTDGSPLLAHAIVRGDLDVTFMNPSALLTQAYRGVGLFREPLPLRVIASYPSWDRYIHAIHPRTGITSMTQLKAERYPLRVSIRADATHSTRVLLDQILALYDFTLDDIVAWGGSLQLVGPPSDAIRLEALRSGEIDAIFDEGMKSWLDAGMAGGLRPIAFEEPVLQQLEALGWRRAPIAAGGPFGRFPHLTEACVGIDYGGWPLYTRADLPEDDVYLLCDALQARADTIPWEPGEYTGIPQLYQETEATPRDVPLHPGAERWCRDHGIAL